MSIERDDELLTRLGSGRLIVADLELDEPTRRVVILLWAWRSDVDSEPISPSLGRAATGKADQR